MKTGPTEISVLTQESDLASVWLLHVCIWLFHVCLYLVLCSLTLMKVQIEHLNDCRILCHSIFLCFLFFSDVKVRAVTQWYSSCVRYSIHSLECLPNSDTKEKREGEKTNTLKRALFPKMKPSLISKK